MVRIPIKGVCAGMFRARRAIGKIEPSACNREPGLAFGPREPIQGRSLEVWKVRHVSVGDAMVRVVREGTGVIVPPRG